MYARVITAQWPHTRLGEAEFFYQERLLPLIDDQPGFRGALMLVDQATGNSLTILLWETEAHLQASERDGRYPQRLGDPFAATPTRSLYEVCIDRRPSP